MISLCFVAINGWDQKLKETGSLFNKKRRGRPKQVMKLSKTSLTVSQEVQNSPYRNVVESKNIPKSIVHVALFTHCKISSTNKIAPILQHERAHIKNYLGEVWGKLYYPPGSLNC